LVRDILIIHNSELYFNLAWQNTYYKFDAHDYALFKAFELMSRHSQNKLHLTVEAYDTIDHILLCQYANNPKNNAATLSTLYSLVTSEGKEEMKRR
jgi:hypothetical protein